MRLTCALSCSHTPPHIEYRRNGHPYTIYKYLYKYMPLQVYTILQTTCKYCKRTTQQQEQAGRTTFSAALAFAFADERLLVPLVVLPQLLALRCSFLLLPLRPPSGLLRRHRLGATRRDSSAQREYSPTASRACDPALSPARAGGCKHVKLDAAEALAAAIAPPAPARPTQPQSPSLPLCPTLTTAHTRGNRNQNLARSQAQRHRSIVH